MEAVAAFDCDGSDLAVDDGLHDVRRAAFLTTAATLRAWRTFANDRCNEGFIWNGPIQRIYDPPTDPLTAMDHPFNSAVDGFSLYLGDWGKGHVSGFAAKGWWKNPQDEEAGFTGLNSAVNIPTDYVIIILILSFIMIIFVIGAMWWSYRNKFAPGNKDKVARPKKTSSKSPNLKGIKIK